jgi:quinol monooxygenase YgiN
MNAQIENVYWVLELAINPGRFEDLETLMATMVEATQRNEVGALNYEWAISNDRQVCRVYERYQDSAAALAHLESFGANFAARFMEVVKADPLRCLWCTDRTGEGCAWRLEPRLHGAFRGL